VPQGVAVYLQHRYRHHRIDHLLADGCARHEDHPVSGRSPGVTKMSRRCHDHPVSRRSPGVTKMSRRCHDHLVSRRSPGVTKMSRRSPGAARTVSSTAQPRGPSDWLTDNLQSKEEEGPTFDRLTAFESSAVGWLNGTQNEGRSNGISCTAQPRGRHSDWLTTFKARRKKIQLLSR